MIELHAGYRAAIRDVLPNAVIVGDGLTERGWNRAHKAIVTDSGDTLEGACPTASSVRLQARSCRI